MSFEFIGVVEYLVELVEIVVLIVELDEFVFDEEDVLYQIESELVIGNNVGFHLLGLHLDVSIDSPDFVSEFE